MTTRNKMRPIPPGEILREQLDELGWSARKLADALGVTPNRVTYILSGKRELTADTALRLERFFGAPSARFWLDLQSAHDLRLAEIMAEKTGSLRSIVPLKRWSLTKRGSASEPWVLTRS